jgi:protein TonB
MPQDMFGEVVRSSVKLGSRAWYQLPLSIAVHLLVVVIAIVVPIVAPGVLPAPATVLASFVASPPPPMPPPPPEPAPASARTAAPQSSLDTIAPSQPPEAISAEPTSPPLPGIGSQVEGGLPSDFGVGTTTIRSLVRPEPPPAAPARPVPVGGNIRNPTKITDVRPVYPQVAQAAKVSGRVIIEATIGADGRVMNARILKSVPLLDQAALDAVLQWRFTPTRLNGVAIPVIMTVTVNFTLG